MPQLRWPQLAQLVKQRPSRPVVMKALLGATAAAALCGAFCWGRYGAPAADARASSSSVLDTIRLTQTGQVPHSAQEIVAYVYDRPIYRWELGEYLIQRFGGERIEFLVNRRIIEMACAANNIRISDAQIKAQLEEDLKGFGCTEGEFVTKILRPRNKSLFEWKEDVILPKLCLQEFVKGQIQVSEDDIQKAFEAKYGPKVECRLIVLPKERAKRDEMWAQLDKDKTLFDRFAKEQFIQPLAEVGGKIPPIHKHFGDESIEREAFRLKPGDISSILELPDHSFVILRCEQHLAADPDARLDKERMSLHREIAEVRLQVEIPKVFGKLREQANPKILIPQPALVPAAPVMRQAAAAPQPMPTPPAAPPSTGQPGHASTGPMPSVPEQHEPVANQIPAPPPGTLGGPK
jgi:hypothetical protein